METKILCSLLSSTPGSEEIKAFKQIIFLQIATEINQRPNEHCLPKRQKERKIPHLLLKGRLGNNKIELIFML